LRINDLRGIRAAISSTSTAARSLLYARRMFAGRKATSTLLGTRSSMLAILCERLSMVRLRAGTTVALTLAVVAVGAGCTGDIVDPAGGDPLDRAIAAFDRDVAPIMNNKCAVCHTAADKPQFMKPNPTLREGIMAYRNAGGGGLLDLMSPIDSRLQVYSSSEAHLAVGTNFSPSEAAKVTSWIELEALAAGVTEQPIVKTTKIAPVIGTNTIDLDTIGLTGSKFLFDFERITTGYYLSRIKVQAGTGGVHLVDPLFVIWEGETEVPDPINRFNGIDLVVAENMESPVGGGTAIFTYPGAVPASPQISIHFKTATFANGMNPTENGGSTGGCKAVAMFTANIKPLLQPCLTCHAGQNGAATGATNMTKVNDDAAQMDACNQILTRVSLANPNQSSVIVSVDPSSTVGHAQQNYKVPAANFTAYKNAMIAWITAEAAP
jgi:hypothetical protein